MNRQQQRFIPVIFGAILAATVIIIVLAQPQKWEGFPLLPCEVGGNNGNFVARIQMVDGKDYVTANMPFDVEMTTNWNAIPEADVDYQPGDVIASFTVETSKGSCYFNYGMPKGGYQLIPPQYAAGTQIYFDRKAKIYPAQISWNAMLGLTVVVLPPQKDNPQVWRDFVKSTGAPSSVADTIIARVQEAVPYELVNIDELDGAFPFTGALSK